MAGFGETLGTLVKVEPSEIHLASFGRVLVVTLIVCYSYILSNAAKSKKKKTWSWQQSKYKSRQTQQKKTHRVVEDKTNKIRRNVVYWTWLLNTWSYCYFWEDNLVACHVYQYTWWLRLLMSIRDTCNPVVFFYENTTLMRRENNWTIAFGRNYCTRLRIKPEICFVYYLFVWLVASSLIPGLITSDVA